MVRPPSGRGGTKQQKEQTSGQVEGDGGDDAEGVAARRRRRRWASLSAPARTLPIPSRSAQSGVRMRQQCSQPRPIPAQPHPFPLIRPRPARVRRRCPGNISLVRPRRRTSTASATSPTEYLRVDEYKAAWHDGAVVSTAVQLAVPAHMHHDEHLPPSLVLWSSPFRHRRRRSLAIPSS